jgi:CRP-like cAMP-binding protein
LHANVGIWRRTLRKAGHRVFLAGASTHDFKVEWVSMTKPANEHVATLSGVELFRGLSATELGYLGERAISRHYRAGESIFSEGEPCEGLYVIERGEVKVFKTSSEGREHVLTVQGPRTSVAELPVFDEGAYPAAAAAVTDVAMLFITKKDFQALCMEHPEISLKVLKVVGSRLRLLVNIIEELSFTTVRQRLAALLLRTAQSNGKKTGRGVEFVLHVTNQDLASQIGTVRELVSRNFARLQLQGVIKLEGKRVIVPNVKALEAEAGKPE